MFEDEAQRINREQWGIRVDAPTDYIQALASRIDQLVQILAQNDIPVSLPPMPTMREFNVYGVDEALQELSMVIGNQQKLTHNAPLVVDATLPDDDTLGAIQVNAYKDNPPTDGDAIAIQTQGDVKVGGNIFINNVQVIALPPGGDPFAAGQGMGDFDGFTGSGTRNLAIIDGVPTWVETDTC